MIDKRRVRANEAKAMNLVGSVEGCRAIILDDMIDTGGTLVKAAKAVMDHGAAEVLSTATHPIFSGPALERIEESPLKEVIVTDTIPLNEKAQNSSKIRVLSVAGILAEAIKRIHNDESVSSLFV
jgi:ribose-phosphate pyrophosphokinase